MSVQSIGNTLTAQQLMQLLGQQALTSADPNAANANGIENGDSSGQNLPTGTNTADAASDSVSGASSVSSPATLDPATIQALLQIQESQSMVSAESMFFGDDNSGVSTGDPLLDAMDGTTNSPYGVRSSDPLLSEIDGSGSTNSMQSMLEELDPSAAGNGSSGSMQSILAELDPSAYGSSSTGSSSLQSILAEIDPSAAAAVGGSTQTTDPTALQLAMDTMSGSATSTNSLTDTNQAMLNFLNAMDTPAVGTATDAATANDLGATQLAGGTNAATQVE